MKSLNELAFRFFRANPFIVFTSVVSIAIAVSLIVTLSVFSSNAKQSLQDEMKALFGEQDLAIVYDSEGPAYDEQALFDFAAAHPGTEEISKVFVTRAFVEPLGGSVYSVGMGNDDLVRSRYNTTVDLDETSVAMSAQLARSLELAVGDEVEIENGRFKLVEIIGNIEGAGIVPDMLIFSLETAQSFPSNEYELTTTALMIKAIRGTDVVAMAVDLQKFDDRLRIDVMEQEDFVKQNMESLTIFIGVMAVLILLVTSMMVISNFDLLLYKNRNQFAIMRAMGARTKQIANIVFIQSTLINVTGTVVGLLLAAGGNRLIQPIFGRLFSIETEAATFGWTVAATVAVLCAIVIQVFLAIPAYKASKALPIQLFEENEKIDFTHSSRRRNWGLLLAGVSLLAILIGYGSPDGGGGKALAFLGGGLSCIIALFLLLPLFMAPILRAMLPAVQNVFGKEAAIAIQTMLPQIRKNTLVILSISLVMTITVFGSVLLNTIQQNGLTYIDKQFPTSIVLKSRLWDSAIPTLELQKKVEEQFPGNAVYTVSNAAPGEIQLAGGQHEFSYAMTDLSTKGLLEEQVKDPTKEIVISKEFAKKHELQVGDTYQIGVFSNASLQVEWIDQMVIGAISPTMPDVDAMMDWKAATFLNEYTTFHALYLDATSEEETMKALEPLKQQYPELQLFGHQKSVDEANTMFLQRWSIFLMVLVALVLSVMTGVCNTLINTVYAKRKEFAVLRTIGVRPRGIGKVILTQVSLYVIIGLCFGTVCGFLLAWIILLIDSGELHVNASLLWAVAAAMLTISIALFVPIGHKLGARKISVEVLQDNK
ncbi:ABC transporter permease [Sporosarcina sp. NCCP-2222]|uniref:FtsX-like permease family protein n=1 Tax=Sporosarcina sp. NCCP-2222 TaxID=2935073 RepID=UPI0020882562|nr:FtsX-like permease family protein [Sporosarcina sp. NCCP-2222]GKV56479.1 ABC transporter permease [Sporosarcina sp. NCCP-2222]